MKIETQPLNTTAVPPSVGNFSLYTQQGLLERQGFTNRIAPVRLGMATGAKIAQAVEGVVALVGKPSQSITLDTFEATFKLRNSERFEQTGMKRVDALDDQFQARMGETLGTYAREFDRPGDLTEGYQKVLGMYLREIQYFSAQGKNGFAAVQHLITEMIEFGLRGPIMTQLTFLQAGEQAEPASPLPVQSMSTENLQKFVLERAEDHKTRAQGVKDTYLYDMGTVDQLMIGLTAIVEIGAAYGNKSLFAWISSNRESKQPQDLAFADVALRMSTSLKHALHGDTYATNNLQVMGDRASGDLISLNTAYESLAPQIISKPETALTDEIGALFALNPQLFMKIVSFFGDYGDRVGLGELGRQIFKQQVRDDSFAAIAEIGPTAHLIGSSEKLTTLTQLAEKCFTAPIFTVGNLDYTHRTTKMFDMITLLREVSNSAFGINESGIKDNIKEQRRQRRNTVIPMSSVAITALPGNDADKSKSLNKIAAKHIKRFGQMVVGKMTENAFDTASGVLSGRENDRSPKAIEIKQKAADTLLMQMIINTIFVSPDSFMPEEGITELRKKYGDQVVRSFHLLMADPDVSQSSEVVLTSILQYIYNHWGVGDITGVLERYKLDTVLNSNSAAFTDGKLTKFVLSLMFPDAEQHLDFDATKQDQLSASVADFLVVIGERMPIWFGRSSQNEFNATLFTGTDDLAVSLQRQWEILAGLQTETNRSVNFSYPALYSHPDQGAQRTKIFTTERAKTMEGTLDIMGQLVKLATFLPDEIKVKRSYSEQTTVMPHKMLVEQLLVPLIDPIIAVYKEYGGRKAPEMFVEQVQQLGQLAQTALGAVNDASPDIDSHATTVQAQALLVAEAKKEVLQQIRSIMKEEGLKSGADVALLELVTKQNDVITAQNQTHVSGRGGLGTQLIQAPATQNDGLNTILTTIASQSTLNIGDLQGLVKELAIPFAGVIEAQTILNREQAILAALKERQDAALSLFKTASTRAEGFEKRRLEVVSFTHRLAEEQRVTIEKLLRQFSDLGFTQLIGWYRQYNQTAVNA